MSEYAVIALTRGQFAIIDKEDENMVSEFNWSAHYNPHTKTFYAVARVYGRRVALHNFIMNHEPSETHGKMTVDHINGYIIVIIIDLLIGILLIIVRII